MDPNNSSPVILIAEDDEDDFFLIREALAEAKLEEDLYWVKDGEELIDFLLRRSTSKNFSEAPRPAMIILDLNLPKKDGRVALQEIKTNPELRKIPVIALTNSKDREDLNKTYDLGVNAFITKPLSFLGFIKIADQIKKFWFETSKLPDTSSR